MNLLERLRYDDGQSTPTFGDLKEAADLIEQQAARIAELSDQLTAATACIGLLEGKLEFAEGVLAADSALQNGLHSDIAELEKDASRLVFLMDASGQFYQYGAEYQIIGRLREYIDAAMAKEKV